MQLPGGVDTIFGDDRFLVAYYGTAGTGSLGVLGEDPPERAFAAPDRGGGAVRARRTHQVMPVFELIVTVADGFAGKQGRYAHDIAKAQVQTLHRRRAPSTARCCCSTCSRGARAS